MPAVEHENAVAFGQLVFQISRGAARVDRLPIVVRDCRRLLLLLFLYQFRVRLTGRFSAFLQLIKQSYNRRLRIPLQTDGNAREPAEGIVAVVDLNDLLAVLEDFAEMGRP